MRRNALLRMVMIALFTSVGLAFQASTDGPYKVLKTAKVGGEGGTDYIYRLESVGVIPGVGGNGATVCPKTGHGFTSDHPQPSMFDVKTMKLIKTIEVPAGFSADGIYCDTSNDRVYIGSHPTKSLIVVDAADGTVLGNVDLGGTPEQTVADGKGRVYQVLQERPGSVAVVDVKTMKVTANYPFGENGGCNGLAIDAKNQILFAACSAIGAGPA